MLREGIALVGIALVLHSRKVKAAQPESELEPADDAPAPPASGTPPLPTIDDAVLGNPLLIGAPYPYGFNITSGQIPGWMSGNHGLGSIPPGLQGGDWTPEMYQAASASYGAIISRLPAAVRWRINNYRRLVNFHKRLWKKIRRWF